MGWRGRIVRTRKEMLYEPSSQLREGFLTVKMIVFQRLWRGLGNKSWRWWEKINASEDRKLTTGMANPCLGARSPGYWEGMYHERNLRHKNVRGWTSWTWTVVFKVERNYNTICCVAQGQIHHPVNSIFFFFKLNTKGSHHWPLNGPSVQVHTQKMDSGHALRHIQGKLHLYKGNSPQCEICYTYSF